MNKVLVVAIILVVVLSLIFYVIRTTSNVQVWRRRFSEFPVRLFEMACGDIPVSTDDGLDVIKLSELLDCTSTKSSKLCFTNNTNNSIASFTKVWLKGVVLPSNLINTMTNSKFEYNLFISNKIIHKHKEYVDNYFLILTGTRKAKIDGKEYTFSKGDIVYIPKDTDIEFWCEEISNQIMLNIKTL